LVQSAVFTNQDALDKTSRPVAEYFLLQAGIKRSQP